MTCRHSDDDPSCSSYPENVRRAQALVDAKKERDALTPDADEYEILQFERVGRVIVLKVLYPNCTLCAYDGTKIMIMPHMSEIQMIQLKRIDPHFRPLSENATGEAPSPIARFPGSEIGWTNALAFAKRLE